MTTKKDAAKKTTTKTKGHEAGYEEGRRREETRTQDHLQASRNTTASKTEVGMKRLSIIALALFALSAQTSTDWVTLFNGKDLNNFNQVGTANWQIVDGVVQANMGAGHLVSKESYTDFEIKVEFFAGPKSNSGVYMRCLDGSKITDKTCYEANVFDNRPDQSGRTGGIPNYAPPSRSSMPKASGTPTKSPMRGDHIVVVLNGMKTVDAHDSTLKTNRLRCSIRAET